MRIKFITVTAAAFLAVGLSAADFALVRGNRAALSFCLPMHRNLS